MTQQSFIVYVIIQGIATLAACCAAIASWRSARHTRQSQKAGILWRCHGRYVEIRRTRSRAIQENSSELAKDYYRELFDLQWSEAQMWKERFIDTAVLRTWLEARSREWTQDRMELQTCTGLVPVTYQDVWKELCAEEYFDPEGGFMKMMQLVHDGDVEQALKVKW